MDAQKLVTAIMDDSQWSDGKEVERLAGLYWTARQGHDDEKAQEIWERMGALNPKRERIVKGDRTIYRLSFGENRYTFDNALCSAGWEQFDTSQDAWYFGVWVNPQTFMVMTYAEGDLSLVTCDTRQAYNAEIERMCEFYDEGRICVTIDVEAKTATEYRQDRAQFFVSA